MYKEYGRSINIKRRKWSINRNKECGDIEMRISHVRSHKRRTKRGYSIVRRHNRRTKEYIMQKYKNRKWIDVKNNFGEIQQSNDLSDLKSTGNRLWVESSFSDPRVNRKPKNVKIRIIDRKGNIP